MWKPYPGDPHSDPCDNWNQHWQSLMHKMLSYAIGYGWEIQFGDPCDDWSAHVDRR